MHITHVFEAPPARAARMITALVIVFGGLFAIADSADALQWSGAFYNKSGNQACSDAGYGSCVLPLYYWWNNRWNTSSKNCGQNVGSTYWYGTYCNDPAPPPPPPSPAFDYSISNSGNITVNRGSSGSNTVTATLTSGSTQSVSFSASGLPNQSSASFSPTSCNPTCSTTLTISTSANTQTGTHRITVSSGSKSTSFDLIVNEPPPPVPGSPTVSASTGTAFKGDTVTFSWNAPAYATSYYIGYYRDNQWDSGWTYVGGGTSANFNTSSLNSWLGAQVIACNSSGCSGASNTVWVAIQTGPDSSPTVTATPTSVYRGQNVSFSWTTPGHTSYFYWFRRNDGGAWSGANYTTGTSILQSTSGVSSSVEIRVRACSVHGVCSTDASATATVTGPPASPTLSSNTTSTYRTNSVAFSWGTVANATSYKIQYGPNGTWSGTWLDQGTNTSVSYTDTANLTSLVAKLQACNPAGCSADSNTITVTFTAPPPSALNVTSVSLTDSDSVTWNTSNVDPVYRKFTNTTNADIALVIRQTTNSAGMSVSIVDPDGVSKTAASELQRDGTSVFFLVPAGQTRYIRMQGTSNGTYNFTVNRWVNYPRYEGQ
ncbi:MAG: hypothetical protein HY462_00760 [Parcubacteria group bacterium]|nr:hypothetical protein [Parcubacteria group bacterium]